ncbi:MAG: hypothetical protein J0L87_06020 [Bacteroidetes bacterium]|nr:hypothetical protein [Bacteroidota bacterium]
MSFALAGGGAMPEYSSFEPVDATDMVNLLTGDFTYNIPVLNVPGPSGGYPLSMFYHSGIGVEQEASWLGLGWNLNPGSINRYAKGIPDDWKDKTTNLISYSGTSTITDWAATVDFRINDVGVGFSVDGGSYKSVGGTVSLSANGVSLSGGTHGASVGMQIPGTQYNAGLNFSPNSVGLNFGYGNINGLGMGVGISSDMDGNIAGRVGVSQGVGKGDYVSSNSTSLGYSISSKGSVAYGSIGSYSFALSGNSINNTLISKNLESTYIVLPIWTYGMASFEYNTLTYWKWAMENKHNFGSIYMKDAKNEISGSGGLQKSNYVGDSYENPYDVNSYNNMELQAYQNALAFANYDSYFVSGQGIGGTMAPKMYENGTLLREGMVFSRYDDDNKNSKTELNYYNKVDFTKTFNNIYFQFDYDNGGFGKINASTIYYNGGSSPMSYTSGGGDLTTDYNGQQFYNNGRVGRSKHIEWFTNSEISTSGSTSYNNAIARGFIDSESQIGQRSNTELYDPDGIGAFSITAEDGKTYYYSLPVYQFEEFEFHEDRSSSGYLASYRVDKYAYDWLLTGVTGPDFVDRGTLGVLDDQDYGYWVKFDYGKWTDGYTYRTPFQDGYYSKSSDGKPYGSYSFGRKQVYYLNDIKTKTHTAYFIKNLRNDGLGKSLTMVKPNNYNGKAAGPSESPSIPPQNPYYYEGTAQLTINTPEPNQLLKLEKIILVKNTSGINISTDNGPSNLFKTKLTTGSTQFQFVNRKHTDLVSGNQYNLSNISVFNVPSYSSYFEDNILDIKDVESNLTTIESKSLKVVEFNHDYSLCSGTPNSSAVSSGKLTLNSVNIYGKGKANLLPPYLFNYNNEIGQVDEIAYDYNKIDKWGYYSNSTNDVTLKPDADAWSLREIVTPMGGKINVTYESDTYSREAMFPDYKLTPQNLSTPSSNQLKYKLVESMSSLGLSFNVNSYYRIKYMITPGSSTPPTPFTIGSQTPPTYYDGLCKLLSVNMTTNELVFEINTVVMTNPIGLAGVYVQGAVCSGGGIRVKDITIDDISGNSYITNYNYNSPHTGKSSGVTSYAPINNDKFIPYIYEIPAPMVMYEFVTVEEKGQAISANKKARFKFDVLQTPTLNGTEFTMGDHLKVENIQPKEEFHTYTPNIDPNNNETHYWHHGLRRSALITDNKSKIGKLVEISLLNKNDEVLERTIYKYGNSSGVGTLQETFTSIKRYSMWNDDGHYSSSSIWNITSASRLSMPSTVSSVIHEKGGMTNTVKNSKYDLLSGAVSEFEYENGFGEKYISKNIPAYVKYSGMSSKLYNPLNKNMLIQSTAGYSYAVDGTGVQKLIGSSVQTWKNAWDYRAYNSSSSKYENSNETDIYRKHQNYVWSSLNDGDGTTNSFVDFVWGAPSQNSGWKKTNEVTLYNHFSQPLEAKDINDQYVSTKMGYSNVYPIATVANAKYTGFAYSGAEDLADGNYMGGEVGGANKRYLNKSVAHTGNYCIRLYPGDYGFSYSGTVGTSNTSDFKKGQKIRASVWVHKLNKEGARLSYNLLNGTTSVGYADVLYSSTSSKQMGNYYLLTLDFTIPAGTTANYVNFDVWYPSGAGTLPLYVDDFRVHPQDAAMTSAVYDEQTGWVTAMLDANNFGSKFYYDDAGRLLRVDVETAQGWKKVSESSYHYGRP